MRLNATTRSNVKNNATGDRHQIELLRSQFPAKKFMRRFAGKSSGKVQEASFTQVGEKIRKLLIIQTKISWCFKKWHRGENCQSERFSPPFKTLAIFVIWRYILVSKEKIVFDTKPTN